MNITQNQGLQYKKLIEGFSSKIGAPKTFDVNNEDLINLENLKKQFDSAVSDYSSLRKIISDNARNYVTLKTKSNQEYKDYIDRNILYAKIFIKPARAVEFIAVDFIITRTGVEF